MCGRPHRLGLERLHCEFMVVAFLIHLQISCAPLAVWDPLIFLCSQCALEWDPRLSCVNRIPSTLSSPQS